jgi:hypothetical protein
VNRILLLASVVPALALWAPEAHSFCGFYVARGDAKIFNRASKVVMVRDGDRTVLTMANDFEGKPKEFAVVVPVPTRLEREQIHIGDRAVVDHLDAYSAPRLVEYFDPDPCARVMEEKSMGGAVGLMAPMATQRDAMTRAKALGVSIEASYTVGEYDILILSAKQSNGLETWLRENGYTIPAGASRVLGSYIKQNMRFFVAKVNVKEQEKLGFSYLRPIQVAYESPKFMLPIRLGMANANGAQELFVFALTKDGRIETTNYRNVRLPDGMDVPEYVKNEFPSFYKAMFERQVQKAGGEAVFTEYAWNMGWCDPCASDPLSSDELRSLGVWWVGGINPAPGQPQGYLPGGGSQQVFITRLHVRYDREHFPEDLVFQQTGDQQNFQGRFVIHHPWKGDSECGALDAYRRDLQDRRSKEAANLAELTGWSVDSIRRKMNLAADWSAPADHAKWWDRIWSKD